MVPLPLSFQQENRGQASIPVKITYVPTGTTRKIRCGWGKETIIQPYGLDGWTALAPPYVPDPDHFM